MSMCHVQLCMFSSAIESLLHAVHVFPLYICHLMPSVWLTLLRMVLITHYTLLPSTVRNQCSPIPLFADLIVHSSYH